MGKMTLWNARRWGGAGRQSCTVLRVIAGSAWLGQKAEPACGGNWSDLFLLTWAWGRAGLAASWQD